MEESVQRRVGVLSRLLLLPLEADNSLEKVLLRGGFTEQEEEAVTNPVVIGGMILDIHGIALVPPSPRTTSPGKINYVPGGVARNIAECMAKLDTKPYMISVVGLDMAGKQLFEQWKGFGLSTEGIQKHPHIKTAVVCNIINTEGEVAAGIASVEAIEKFLTPEWIQQSRTKIISAPILMVDANLGLPALEASCQMAAECDIPVWFEPVSVTKSRRIASVVKFVTFVSPNEDELVAMANALSSRDSFFPIEKDDRKKFSAEYLFKMLKPAILVLLEKGIKLVFLTLGENGVFLCSKGSKFMKLSLEKTRTHKPTKKLYHLVAPSCPAMRTFEIRQTTDLTSDVFAVHFPALPASIVRLTGAGDCLVGGTLASLCSGLDVMQSVAVGIAVAKSTVEAETNVPAAFDLAKIAGDASLVYSAAKVLFSNSGP
ncbi:hypothetical protein K2173_013503 [Erythroxylum novogranatense]|uniref:Carbohydrate kinase PfkB domain-containing protein n=1 Tax=Erythroxylum novogranatense TaxID=1862640 RepID=A0AAV8TJQ2_9ROSI|nr:hypothetical protein K2173_013503 [Erythroxylum novogranatense]